MDERSTVSVPEAARLAEVSEATVRRWCSYRYLKASRVAPERGQWLIDRTDLLRKLGKEG